jgi:uncharacterized membrane protein YphA (DoxX/SURF4 family)
MAWLAVSAEVLGAIALLIGLATRWFTIPLMATMLVATFKGRVPGILRPAS